MIHPPSLGLLHPIRLDERFSLGIVHGACCVSFCPSLERSVDFSNIDTQEGRFFRPDLPDHALVGSSWTNTENLMCSKDPDLWQKRHPVGWATSSAGLDVAVNAISPTVLVYLITSCSTPLWPISIALYLV